MRTAIILSFALLCAASAPVPVDKPNVVVIMADDIGFECYSGYGSEFYKTPAVDALGASGARFTQAYSNPICTPSRVKIMTGRYNFRNYVRFGKLDLTQPTIGRMVKENGYATAIAGKWQLSPGDLDGPHKAGFDEYCLWHFANAGGGEKLPEEFRSKGSRYKDPRLFQNGRLVTGTDGGYGPDFVSDFICDFIEQKKDVPFLVYYPMILVHNPFVPTPDSPDWEKTDKKRAAREHFRDMVHRMDKNVGKVIAALEKNGLREKTLVIVTGDNGTNTSITSPFPGRGEIRGGKGKMTDAGTRVAFVANWPGRIRPGTVVDAPVDFADVLPTIAEVTGSKVPEGTDGRSFFPLVTGDASRARGWIFMSYARGGGSYRCFVRDREWKLYGDGSLYHVPKDWLEETPAAGEDADRARARLQPIFDRIVKDAPEGRIQRGAPKKKGK